MTEIVTSTAVRKPGGIQLPLGVKLILIVTIILLGSIYTVIFLMNLMVSSEFVRTAGNTNSTVNSRAAAGVEERIYKIRADALLLMDIYDGLRDNDPMARQIKNAFFERNPYYAGIIIPGRREILNEPFLSNNEIPPDALNSWISNETAAIENVSSGDPQLKNASPELGINLLALLYPWQDAGKEETVVVFFSPQSLMEITSAGSSFTFITNGEGEILISPDFGQVFSGANIAKNALFEALQRVQGDSISLSFSEGGNRFVGAGQKISIADIAVFSTMEYSVINEQVIMVTRRNILLSITVLFLTILVTWFFSKSITTPVKKLITAVGRIESGDFNTGLEPKSRDELGKLTGRFKEMGQELGQLQERSTLAGRYNYQKITDKLKTGELKLEGEYINAVILSAEFTSFDEISAGIEAVESLELLNMFIRTFTECIEKAGGIIDKIMGNRLIAFWGIPSPSSEPLNDVLDSLRSVLSMRAKLWDLNTERQTQGKTHIRMSCGIHAGKLLSGAVGTGSSRVYTVTGTAIDGASRCADACDSVKTDILITQAVRDLAESRIIAEEVSVSSSVYFGFVNLSPSGDQETQRWPFTLNDVRESLISHGVQARSEDEPEAE